MSEKLSPLQRDPFDTPKVYITVSVTTGACIDEEAIGIGLHVVIGVELQSNGGTGKPDSVYISGNLFISSWSFITKLLTVTSVVDGLVYVHFIVNIKVFSGTTGP